MSDAEEEEFADTFEEMLAGVRLRRSWFGDFHENEDCAQYVKLRLWEYWANGGRSIWIARAVAKHGRLAHTVGWKPLCGPSRQAKRRMVLNFQIFPLSSCMNEDGEEFEPEEIGVIDPGFRDIEVREGVDRYLRWKTRGYAKVSALKRRRRDLRDTPHRERLISKALSKRKRDDLGRILPGTPTAKREARIRIDAETERRQRTMTEAGFVLRRIDDVLREHLLRTLAHFRLATAPAGDKGGRQRATYTKTSAALGISRERIRRAVGNLEDLYLTDVVVPEGFDPKPIRDVERDLVLETLRYFDGHPRGAVVASVPHLGHTKGGIYKKLERWGEIVRPKRVFSVPREVKEIRPIDDVIEETYLEALKACNGNVKKAAKKLGVGRATLYRKMEEWNRDGRDIESVGKKTRHEIANRDGSPASAWD